MSCHRQSESCGSINLACSRCERQYCNKCWLDCNDEWKFKNGSFSLKGLTLFDGIYYVEDCDYCFEESDEVIRLRTLLKELGCPRSKLYPKRHLC